MWGDLRNNNIVVLFVTKLRSILPLELILEGNFELKMMITTTIIAEMHLLILTINCCQVSLANAARRLFVSDLMIVSDDKRHLISDFVLAVIVEKEVKVVWLVLSLSWDENRVYFVIFCITKLTNFTKICLTDKESKDFIRLGMVFFYIDVATKENNILKRNDLINYLILVLDLIICNIDQRIHILLLNS